MNTLKVNIDVDEVTISIYDNGCGIPIKIHSQEKSYIPKLIFSHLLSSSNYDNDEKKLTSGHNGHGAKLTNIYSQNFTVNTANTNTKPKLGQRTWTRLGNQRLQRTARRRRTHISCSALISSILVWAVLMMTQLPSSNNVSMTWQDVKVFLNNEHLKVKGFKSYVKMHLNSAAAQAAVDSGVQLKQNPQLFMSRQVIDGRS